MLLLLICDAIIKQDVHFIFCILQIYSLSCNDIVTKFLALVQRELKKRNRRKWRRFAVLYQGKGLFTKPLQHLTPGHW